LRSSRTRSCSAASRSLKPTPASRGLGEGSRRLEVAGGAGAGSRRGRAEGGSRIAEVSLLLLITRSLKACLVHSLQDTSSSNVQSSWLLLADSADVV